MIPRVRGHALHVVAAMWLLLAPATSAAQPARSRRAGGCTLGVTGTLTASAEPLMLGGASIGVGAVGALAVWFEGDQGRVLPLDASFAPASGATPRPLAIEGRAIEGVFPLGTGFVVITEATCRGSGGCYLLYATNASGELVGTPGRMNVGALRSSTVQAADDGSLVAMLIVPTSWDEPIHVVEIRAGDDGPVLSLEDVTVLPGSASADVEPDDLRYAFVVDAAGWGFAGPLVGAAGDATLAREGGARALLPHALPPMSQVALYFEGSTLRYSVAYGDGVRG